jgi:hypothetical protein
MRYYSLSLRTKQDSVLLQVVVYFTLLTDTVSTASTYAFVYLVCSFIIIPFILDMTSFCSILSRIGVDLFISLQLTLPHPCVRKRNLPPKPTLALCNHACDEWRLGDDCAKFLDLPLLEAVSSVCFHYKFQCSKHTLFRSENKYIASMFILFMIAAVG